MDAQFWINAWKEGRTGFHQEKPNEKLVEHFPKLKPQKGQTVLVPLCGKSVDLLWLHGLGLRVHGVELHEDAVKAFFADNQLPLPAPIQGRDFIHYGHKDIILSCGNFFDLNVSGSCDLVYDRASLVALPEPMRREYARVITRVLKPGGKCLLIVYEYEPSQMQGPPFSVTESEIRALYSDAFTIRRIEIEKPAGEAPRLAAVESLRQAVYVLEKTQ